MADTSGSRRASSQIWQYNEKTDELSMTWMMDDDTEAEIGALMRSGQQNLHFHRLSDSRIADHYLDEFRVKFYFIPDSDKKTTLNDDVFGWLELQEPPTSATSGVNGRLRSWGPQLHHQPQWQVALQLTAIRPTRNQAHAKQLGETTNPGPNIPWLNFSGSPEESVATFIQSVQRAAITLNNMYEDRWLAHYAAAFLSGAALLWYLELDDETCDSWKKLRKALVAKYYILEPDVSELNSRPALQSSDLVS
ncbi:hypothetical protein FRB90_005284 [Tulasnella sp. 427]|nr:hypothetical protein FRB90_005284 [Tulasnella sp. 427]